MTKLITCRLFVKYLDVYDYVNSGYRILRTHAPKVRPNSQIVIAPPLVIVLIPHLHIPQLRAKKKHYIIVIMNIDICESLVTNIDTVITIVSVAYTPFTNAPADNDVVELKVPVNTYAQK